MRKSRTLSKKGQASGSGQSAEVRIELPALAQVSEGFFALCAQVGHQVLSAMMEHDRTMRCGAKGIPNPGREALRWGSTPSLVVLGGRQIEVRRLRARSREGREVELPSYRWAAERDPLDEHTVGAIASGVATRRYKRTLDPLPPGEREVSISKSAVSRRFVALSTKEMAVWLGRRLEDLDLRAIEIDGIAFRDHTLVIALGVTSGAEKVVLGVREGTTENAAVTKALLGDLIERGLPTEHALLFVIDGSKALRQAILAVFGKLAVIQRCQVHKTRNVVDHLPDRLKGPTKRAMQDAYAASDAAVAQQKLERLSRSLEREHPGAAASLREGMAETLTLLHLGITGPLYRCLRSTNAIENLNGSVAHFTRNVRCWRDGRMIVRWVVTALAQAQKHFRRLKGERSMHRLLAALEAHEREVQLDTTREVA